jgi:hypothetical protein
LNRPAPDAAVFVDDGLLPPGPRLEPEDRCRDRCGAVAGRLLEQALGNAGVRLGYRRVEFIPVVFMQRRLRDADDIADIFLRDAVCGQSLDLLAAWRLSARAALGLCPLAFGIIRNLP